MLADPHGYGRIVRDAHGAGACASSSSKDASADERAIREVNTGMLLMPAAHLRRLARPRSSNDNAQGEYYLTDIIAMAVRRRRAGGRPCRGRRRPRVMGVNDRAQLAALEREYQRAAGRAR